MRLHQLRIEAFGPFTGCVDVDLDELSEAGLFLLSGATGAGKTSVLDAICFALYGDVPGDRGAAKRLRSDRAATDAVPRVTLDATLGGRRFRFVRSPAWERPKKRGTGTTVQQAGVTVSELTADGWRPLTSRLDEAGDLVGRLLGLSLTQFTQVTLLPQGRFQAFLRARSDDRHRLLQQLFRTGRFEQVERWLRERRLTLGRSQSAVGAEVAGLVHRLSEAADAAPPDGWAEGWDGDPDLPGPWASSLATDAAEHFEAARAEAGTAAATERSERERLALARRLDERRRRRRDAEAELAGLRSRGTEHDDAVVRLAAARRAAGVVPLHAVALTASSRAHAARESAAAALASARRVLPADAATDNGALRAAAEAAARAAADVRAALPQAERLTRLRSATLAAQGAVATLSAEAHALSAVRTEAEQQVDELREQVAATDLAAVESESLTATLRATQVRRHARLQADDLAADLTVARESWLDARRATLDARDALVSLQTARLDGMAAELAVGLAVGGCCPVCGSAEHPDLAAARPGSPDATAERTARTAVDDAVVTEHAHDERVRSLETNLAALHSRAGDDRLADLDEELVVLTDRLRPLTELVGRREELRAALHQAQTELTGLDERRSELATQRVTQTERLAAATGEAAALATRLAQLLGDHPPHNEPDDEPHDATEDSTDAFASRVGDRLSARLVEDGARRSACETALMATADAVQAEQAEVESRAALLSAAAGAGFESPEEAVAAALDRDRIERLAGAVADHERRLAAVHAVLEDLGDLDADSVDAQDLATVEASHAAALAALTDAEAEARRWSGRGERLDGLYAALGDALARWAPLRADLDLVSALASFCDGTALDNRLRMRLSAYVLAYRLSQVVAAANERLAQMSDQRYSLEHTGRRGAGETRGGLSLLVRDDWSGESRDPATLSGGETFVVSLALALGLADVISNEAGGAALDTLFVDEGFGSLDADTLDDVLDTLDALRDGGRVVGVVSHVAEMRDRIPTQLVVTKARTGSTVSLRR